MLDFLWVRLLNVRPRRFCMVDWTMYLVGFLIGFFSWFTCWIFSGYASPIGTLGSYSGGVDFSKISDRYLNVSLCEFTSGTSGLEVAGCCSV